jgi:hypothetical protein
MWGIKKFRQWRISLWLTKVKNTCPPLAKKFNSEK